MFEDLKELLSVLNEHGVKYLIVGGYAVSFHAQPRATKDLDLFIKADLANATAARNALISFGAPLSEISATDLANPLNFVRFGREPLAVDILPGIDGVNFDDAWEHKVIGVIDKESGLTAYFISKDDLVTAKLAAGRARDLADVEEIRTASKNYDLS